VLAVQCRFSPDAITTSGEPKVYQRVAPSGRSVHFSFCGKCGATVWYQLDGQVDVIVPIGNIVPRIGTPPSLVIYAENCPEWLNFGAEIELD